VAAWCAVAIESIGIATITLFAVFALFNAALGLIRKEESESIYQELRQTLGRGILLGLEFLIASDIIYTVAVELTFETIGVLAIVVLIRTFLSLTLEVEMSGRWPWQNKE
jgi:uncharacterized membrane protein